MDIKDQMLVAKSLIQQKRYDEARAILNTIQHPTAQKWLAKLEQIHPEKKIEKPKRNRVWLIIGGVVGLLAIVGLLNNASERRQTPELRQLIDTIETSQSVFCNAAFIDGFREATRYGLCMDIVADFSGCAAQVSSVAEVLTCDLDLQQTMCSLIYFDDESGKSECQGEAIATATANAAPK